MITTQSQLDALERRGRCATKARKVDFSITTRQPSAPRGTLEIPPPENGCTYTCAEAAKICGVGRKTVRNWTSKAGRRANGATVRLAALEVPKGEIAPEALCRFLARVNTIDVTVAHQSPSRDVGAVGVVAAAPNSTSHGASPGTPPCNCPPGPPRNSFNNGLPQRQGGTEQ